MVAAAFPDLLAEHMPIVRAVAKRYAGLMGVAVGADFDELVQVLSIRLCRLAESYDGRPGKTFGRYAWIPLGQAARRCVTFHRRRGMTFVGDRPVDRTKRPPPLNFARLTRTGPPSGGELPEDFLFWESVLAALPPGERDVISLRFRAGMTHREVGAALGFSRQTSLNLETAALERLRTDRGRMLAEHVGHEEPTRVRSAGGFPEPERD